MAEAAVTGEGLATPFDIERSPLLGDIPHGFFGSGGGAHQFGYGGPGERDAICALRSAAAKKLLPGAPLQTPHQVHSPDVITIGKKWPDTTIERPVADAVVTARNDIVIGVVTADCGPVLLADPKAGVVAAAHAGWRGAHGGVLENTVTAMEALGAKRADIAAVVGPTIAQPSYEVDAAFRTNFTTEDEIHFQSAPMREGQARWHFDLPGYIVQRLQAAGITSIAVLGRDTYSEPDRYYSYRRAVQLGEPTYGRQLSAIALK